MNELSQEIKIICQNSLIKGSAKAADGHPWRNWKVKVVAVDNYRERKGKLSYLLDRVEYVLHPTFENPVRTSFKEPYLLQEKGWGEFDMRVVLYFKNDWAEPQNIFFDLHFREPTYTILHKVTFYHPPLPLARLITHEFPPSDVEIAPRKRKMSPSLSNITTTKKARTPPSIIDDNSSESNGQDTIVDHVYDEKDVDTIDAIHSAAIDEHTRKAWGLPDNIDICKLAKRLTTLTSEQTEEVEFMIKNHILDENEDEFVIDLYSLGPDLLTQLWEFTEKKSKSSVILSPFSLVQANTAFIDD
ncbi:hypothetical protein G6F57_002844 [Rhizopus arrhizus]|uniref:YEATS domain-containing protein n=1 Tax=Rhizopus oryzae TaxID=64495 RepID=A0A9P7BVX8_RHIOR|nr:hypothetical protein G6F24_002443 [Rhizopus arrhizus]KAG1416016.1 hypothetical protein G6F58_006188 [Rhizopus delemar]KAG0792362.1 hypothetical protein G6F21_004415 [Rhizopus arrhizus]KAG0815776.1 hypothetical protein G6F20_003726 [Rhizopus arrhizus]KAG0840291.1 hypothetical protein G6F18_003739 [Rhizopus arrhizus]